MIITYSSAWVVPANNMLTPMSTTKSLPANIMFTREDAPMFERWRVFNV